MTELALPDVNVLVALVAASHEHHTAAHDWFAGIDSWATTPVTEAGLLRLVLNPAVVGGHIGGAAALDVLRGLRRQKQHRWLTDDTSLAEPRIDLSALVGHRQITDLHLVNLAATHGARLHTFDARLVASLAADDRRHVALVPVIR